MALSKKSSPSSKSLVLIAMVLAIAALYLWRRVFIPLALSVIFSFLLMPAVTLLERIRFRRVPALWPPYDPLIATQNPVCSADRPKIMVDSLMLPY